MYWSKASFRVGGDEGNPMVLLLFSQCQAKAATTVILQRI